MMDAAYLVNCYEQFKEHLTIGESMLLAMVCRALYSHVLGYLRNRIHELIRLPLETQPIYYMNCFHNCNQGKTAFVCILKPTSVVARCTHCLYGSAISYGRLPAPIWGMKPSHEVCVKQILQRTGARHTLLSPIIDKFPS